MFDKYYVAVYTNCRSKERVHFNKKLHADDGETLLTKLFIETGCV